MNLLLRRFGLIHFQTRPHLTLYDACIRRMGEGTILSMSIHTSIWAAGGGGGGGVFPCPANWGGVPASQVFTGDVPHHRSELGHPHLRSRLGVPQSKVRMGGGTLISGQD